MSRFVVAGTVTSGLGDGAAFVSLDGYNEQFQQQLGYEPYPGTLNLSVDSSPEDRFEGLAPVRVEAWSDDGRTFGAVRCYPATVRGRTPEAVPLHAIVPERSEYDTSTIEFVSPRNLRETLDLAEGSVLEVSVRSHRSDGTTT